MKTVVGTHHEIVQEFIKALGLDAKKIHSLNITFATDDIVLLETTSFVYEEEMEEMTELVKKYRLTVDEIEE